MKAYWISILRQFKNLPPSLEDVAVACKEMIFLSSWHAGKLQTHSSAFGSGSASRNRAPNRQILFAYRLPRIIVAAARRGSVFWPLEEA